MHTQELLAAVHDILINRSTANIRATFEGVTEGTTKHDSTGNFLFRKSTAYSCVVLGPQCNILLQILVLEDYSFSKLPLVSTFSCPTR